MRMMKLNNRLYAAGLVWSGIITPNTGRAALRKRISQEKSFDVFAVRKLRYGLADSGGDPASWLRARALASALRVTWDSFLGLFHLIDDQGERFWWVLAVNGGELSAHGDKVFSSREEAEQHIDGTLKVLIGDFERVEIRATVEESEAWLTPLLHTRFPATLTGRLKPIHPRPQKRLRLAAALAFAALVGAAGYGGTLYSEYLDGREAATRADQALRTRERRLRELTEHPERYFKAAWRDAPAVRDVADACMARMRDLPLVTRGWEMAGAECRTDGTGAGMKAFWDLGPQADFVELPFSGRLETPQRAVSTLPVTLATAMPAESGRVVRDTPLLTEDMAARHLYQITQDSGTRLRLSFLPPEKAKVEDVELVAPWCRGQWEIAEVSDFPLLDSSLFDALARLPGLTLKNITHGSIAHGTAWVLKGDIHVQNVR